MRRLRARALLFAGAVIVSCTACSTRPLPRSSDPAVQARYEARWRERRIILNNDGNEIVYLLNSATPEEVLSKRTTGLVGTQVDTLFYCTWSSGFGMFTHATDVAERFTATTGVFGRNLTGDLLAAGHDPLRIVSDYCREQGIEIFWSMRMNDTHDVSVRYPEMFPQFKRDHPEYLVGSAASPTRHGRWTSVDYTHAEVRDYAFRIIEEICTRYDVDGVELDFFRHPTLFANTARGGTASDEERALMIRLMRRIRTMADARARDRGRPLLIAVRVPDSVGYCRDLGIDLEVWLAEDLVDLLVVGGYFRLEEWETSVELGHRHGVPVFPCLSESRMRSAVIKTRQSQLSYRARAAAAWQAGADGIYLFNYHNTAARVLREIGDPKVLAGVDKTYFPAYRDTRQVESFLASGMDYQARPTPALDRALAISADRPQSLRVEVADEIPRGSTGADRPRFEARVLLRNREAAGSLRIRINRTPLKDPRSFGAWTRYSVPSRAIRAGVNTIDLEVGPGSEDLVVVDCGIWYFAPPASD